ncbi:MAG: MotA/TolQ/ExbB proton channel family protein, partial [Bacteroidia bacterium]
MKKLFALFLALGLLLGSSVNILSAQGGGEPTSTAQTNDTIATKTEPVADEAPVAVAEDSEEKGIHQVIKEKFIEGDPVW